MTYDHDAVIVTLAARASIQVRDGLAALQGGKLLEAEVQLRAAHATLSSLAILLEKPEPKPFRKLVVVGPAKAEDSDLQPWMSQKFGGPDDGAA
jgi:hypothetical protein